MRFLVRNNDYEETSVTVGKKSYDVYPTSDLSEFIGKFRYIVVSDQAFKGSKAAKLKTHNLDYNFYKVEFDEYCVCVESLKHIGMQKSPKILFFRGVGKKG